MLKLFSALAIADLSSLDSGSQAALGCGGYRHRLIGGFIPDQIKHDLHLAGRDTRMSQRSFASIECVPPFGRSYFVFFAPAWPRYVWWGANSPSLWPTISSVT